LVLLRQLFFKSCIDLGLCGEPEQHRGQYEEQSDPYYATSRLWDDGLIDPIDTRDALGLCLALAARHDEPQPGPGLVYRM
ncbi:MAG: carboxyl transferase domain-containing protein, partial [Acidimicrobiales bacterium]